MIQTVCHYEINDLYSTNYNKFFNRNRKTGTHCFSMRKSKLKVIAGQLLAKLVVGVYHKPVYALNTRLLCVLYAFNHFSVPASSYWWIMQGKISSAHMRRADLVRSCPAFSAPAHRAHFKLKDSTV